MSAEVLPDSDFSTLSNDELDDALTEFCAHMNAAEYRLIQLIEELDRRMSAGRHVVATVPQWLGFKCGIDAGAAREKLRVARALRELPVLREAFARGEVSYSKVRAVTRVAVPSNEDLLLGYAKSGTAAQIERVVRGYRRLERLSDPDTVLRQRRARGLKWHFDEDGMLVLHGRFPPEEGALILEAMETVRARMFREERAAESEDLIEQHHGRLEDDVDESVQARRADALVRLVEAGVQADPAAVPGGERTLVVLHVPTPAASEQDANSSTQAPHSAPELEDGPVVSAETARRLACDASLVVQRENAKGEALSIGRRSRTVPHWLQRALRQRDGGCRFPGCTRTHHVDAHHIEHWADGGETSLDNLVLLCRHHHRLVHEDGFVCRRSEARGIEFTRPDGAVLPDAVPLKRGDYLWISASNARAGVHITPRTCDAGWDGRRVDYSEAVAQIWHRTMGRDRI